MNDLHVSEHSLHLLVDGQLDADSRRRLVEQISKSPALQKRLDNIKRIRELVGLAYLQEEPRKVKKGFFSKKPTLLPSFALVMMMTIGLTLGWFAHGFYMQQFPMQVAEQESIGAIAQSQQTVMMTELEARKFMLHMEAIDHDQLMRAISETISLLESYAASGIPLKIDLLFDEQSVEIFKPRYATQVATLKSIIKQHPNIQFYACSEALRLLLGDIEMPPEMVLFHTDKVVKQMIPERIDDGWIYIKA